MVGTKRYAPDGRYSRLLGQYAGSLIRRTVATQELGRDIEGVRNMQQSVKSAAWATDTQTRGRASRGRNDASDADIIILFIIHIIHKQNAGYNERGHCQHAQSLI